ncbi:MAG: two-component system LytT family response regulator [Saprospiraceae bacterium]|jgi:two-component system LytT family response regulator
MHTPDILSLDIILGDGTGFELLEILPSLNTKVIFITASDEYAIKAFRFSAIDYLLKPYNPQHLSESVSRATQETTSSNESLAILKETISNPESLPKRISLHS